MTPRSMKFSSSRTLPGQRKAKVFEGQGHHEIEPNGTVQSAKEIVSTKNQI